MEQSKHSIDIDGMAYAVPLPTMGSMQQFFDVLDGLQNNDSEIYPLLSLFSQTFPDLQLTPPSLISASFQYLTLICEDLDKHKRLLSFYESRLKVLEQEATQLTPQTDAWHGVMKTIRKVKAEMGQTNANTGYTGASKRLLEQQGHKENINSWLIWLSRESGFSYKDLLEMTWAEFIGLNNQIAASKELEFAARKDAEKRAKNPRMGASI